MKRKLPLLLSAFFIAFSVVACEGPVGPKGDPGPAGEKGETGAPGAPGQDGTNALNTCSDCHSSDATIVAAEFQMANSGHAAGEFEVRHELYAGGSCVDCHSHQGFIEATTDQTADWTFGPSSITCRTCHQIHTDLDEGDFALTTTDPVTIRLTSASVNFAVDQDADIEDVFPFADSLFGGNVCANCHQARVADPMPSATAASDATYEITSSHFGIHYGTQANVVSGEADPIEFTGALNVAMGMNAHGEDAGCTGCHMAFPDDENGGHTFSVWEGDRYKKNVCAECHQSATGQTFDVNGIQTTVTGLLTELSTCLQVAGVMDAGGHPVTDDAATTGVDEGTHLELDVAAFLVYQLFQNDGSLGVHQPYFTKNLLNNTIDNMETRYAACSTAVLN